MVLLIDSWTPDIYGFSALSFTVFPMELKALYYDEAIKYTE